MNKLQWKSYYREQRFLRKEIWKDVLWYEWLYQVSSVWRIYSILYNRIKYITITDKGYHRVRLSRNGVSKGYFVHRIVLIAFNSAHTEWMECNHINRIRSDNRICNLEWITHQENMKHILPWLNDWSHLPYKGKKVYQISKWYEILAEYKSMEEASRITKINRTSISLVCSWKQKTAGRYRWKVAD